MGLGQPLNSVLESKLQLAIGILLLLFGMRLLRKAILRSAGVIRLHDELTDLAIVGFCRPVLDRWTRVSHVP